MVQGRMAEPLNFHAYRIDLDCARRRASLKEYAEFCRLQRARLAKRMNRSVTVIRNAQRRAVYESDGDAALELIASRKG